MYTKPIIIPNEEIAEGIYAASGDCYYVTAEIKQRPETGRGDHRIQVNGRHDTDHHSSEQILTLTFNMPVVYKSSNGTLVGGSGTNSIHIKYNYHNNGVDNIGLGDVVVESDTGLAIMGCSISCNRHCMC